MSNYFEITRQTHLYLLFLPFFFVIPKQGWSRSHKSRTESDGSWNSSFVSHSDLELEVDDKAIDVSFIPESTTFGDILSFSTIDNAELKLKLSRTKTMALLPSTGVSHVIDGGGGEDEDEEDIDFWDEGNDHPCNIQWEERSSSESNSPQRQSHSPEERQTRRRSLTWTAETQLVEDRSKMEDSDLAEFAWKVDSLPLKSCGGGSSQIIKSSLFLFSYLIRAIMIIAINKQNKQKIITKDCLIYILKKMS